MIVSIDNAVFDVSRMLYASIPSTDPLCVNIVFEGGTVLSVQHKHERDKKAFLATILEALSRRLGIVP